MRRGCVSLGEIKCDECKNVIPYPDRYLAVDEKDGVEDEEGETHLSAWPGLTLTVHCTWDK
jgi:hypothetical protein